MVENVMPDSQEIADEVSYSVRVMEIQEYGKSRLPAGPSVDESDEVIVVEGRADVLNLLKHGIKNVIAINGTSIPEDIAELGKRKILTVFVDGDRGGDLIIKELMAVAEIDFVTKAPDGKEVEEITKKEIHKALRSKITVEQAKLEMSPRTEERRHDIRKPQYRAAAPSGRSGYRKVRLSEEQKTNFKDMLDGLIGTRGSYILDESLNILGKVPITEIESTLKSLTSGIYAVVFDGIIDKNLISAAERSSVKFLVAMDSKIDDSETRVNILTSADLE